MSILTKGNVVVDKIKIGDIHYEYGYNTCIITEVVSLPIRDEDGLWSWESKKSSHPETKITYSVSEKYPHYGPKIYDYKAYTVKNYI